MQFGPTDGFAPDTLRIVSTSICSVALTLLFKGRNCLPRAFNCDGLKFASGADVKYDFEG